MSSTKKENLRKAKQNKNDEFYTRFDDVKNELDNYKEQLKNRAILMPCDNDYNLLTKEQKQELYENGLVKGYNDGFAFSQYFINNNVNDPEFLKASPGYQSWNNQLYYASYNPKTDTGIKFQDSIREFAKKHPDGVVITNPPFSLFREFISVLEKTKLDFIILGNNNAITYKEVFKLIKENKIWLGYHSNKTITFTSPNPNTSVNQNEKINHIKVPAISWFTNLKTKTREEKLILVAEYKNNENKYPKYDNFDAININKVREIPYDYQGNMGVPITFLDKFNPKQFEIIGKMSTTKPDNFELGYPYINGKRVYARIIIKNKNPEII